MLPLLLPCYSLFNRLSGFVCKYWTNPFSSTFFTLSTQVSPVSHIYGVYNYFAISCASSPLFRPPRSYPRTRSRYPRPRSHLRYCPRFRPRSHPRSHPVVFVYGSPPPCVSMFFTLTDRASTIPSNIRGCQSATWSAANNLRLLMLEISTSSIGVTLDYRPIGR